MTFGLNISSLFRFLICIITLIALHGCEPDDYIAPTENCDEYFAIDSIVSVRDFFDYGNTDTLRYLRMRDGSDDTLTFIKTKELKDSLRVNITHNQYCYSAYGYHERWLYLYKDISNNQEYEVSLIGMGDNPKTFLGATYLVRTNSITFFGEFGQHRIGSIGFANYSFEHTTSQGLFLDNWGWSLAYDYHRFDGFEGGFRGVNQDFTASTVYNIQMGRIQFSFDNGEEVWDLIPPK